MITDQQPLYSQACRRDQSDQLEGIKCWLHKIVALMLNVEVNLKTCAIPPHIFIGTGSFKIRGLEGI